MQDRFNRFFIDDIFEEKQQVDVGLRMNGGAAISSNRHQRERLRIIAVSPKIPDNFVELFADDSFSANIRRVGKELCFYVVYEGFQFSASRRLHRATS